MRNAPLLFEPQLLGKNSFFCCFKVKKKKKNCEFITQLTPKICKRDCRSPLCVNKYIKNGNDAHNALRCARKNNVISPQTCSSFIVGSSHKFCASTFLTRKLDFKFF